MQFCSPFLPMHCALVPGPCSDYEQVLGAQETVLDWIQSILGRTSTSTATVSAQGVFAAPSSTWAGA
jgi:hypothetical protein